MIALILSTMIDLRRRGFLSEQPFVTALSLKLYEVCACFNDTCQGTAAGPLLHLRNVA